MRWLASLRLTVASTFSGGLSFSLTLRSSSARASSMRPIWASISTSRMYGGRERALIASSTPKSVRQPAEVSFLHEVNLAFSARITGFNVKPRKTSMAANVATRKYLIPVWNKEAHSYNPSKFISSQIWPLEVTNRPFVRHAAFTTLGP